MTHRHLTYFITAVLLALLVLVALPVLTRGLRAVEPASVPLAAGNDTLTASATVTYDRAAAVNAAKQYGDQFTNDFDDCYIYADPDGNNPSCTKQGVSTTPFDGAHFIDCVLRAGGLPKPYRRCDPTQSSWNARTYLRMRDLVPMLESIAGYVTEAEVVPGDILIMSNNRGPCWGGVVVETGSAIRVAVHAVNGANSASADPKGLHCKQDDPTPTPTTLTYLHIRTDTQGPIAQFTAPEAGRVPYGLFHIAWIAADEQGGSGVKSYTVRRSSAGGPSIDIAVDTADTSRDVSLPPCLGITLVVTATDNAHNIGPPATRVITTGLQGDFDLTASVDPLDLTAVEAAWGLRSGQPGFDPRWDINADGRIDAADTLWMRQHVGDRCP